MPRCMPENGSFWIVKPFLVVKPEHVSYSAIFINKIRVKWFLKWEIRRGISFFRVHISGSVQCSHNNLMLFDGGAGTAGRVSWQSTLRTETQRASGKDDKSIILGKTSCVKANEDE